jgi:molybdopterin/thiamine biosynthesis adenylyltransferase
MSYTLNPFAVVSETQQGFMICVSDRHRVMLPAQNREFVGELIRGTPMTPDVFDRYISKRRFNELLAKNILLNGNAPPVEGRYSRQQGFFSLATPDYRVHEAALREAHAVVLGAGGVGSHVAWNLAAMGVGRMTIVDFDMVEESNLNRQLYTTADIGLPKVDILCERLAAFNPHIELRPVRMKITSVAEIAGLIGDATVVVKAIDTPTESNGWTNEACVNAGVPFVIGGFLEQHGVVGPSYIPGRSHCLVCVDPPEIKRLHGTGATFAPLVTYVSSMLALCAFKIIVGNTDEIVNKVFSFDTRTATLETLHVQSRQTCKLCAHPPSFVEPPRATQDSKLWFYRGSILALMLIGAAILGIGHDRYTGMLMFAAFIASLPALDLIVGGNPRTFRREAFVISCIYVITNILLFGILRLPGARFSFHITMDGVFSFVQTVLSAIGITAVMTTFLFAIGICYVACIKKLSNTTESWFS